jgi:hypothetical protein
VLKRFRKLDLRHFGLIGLGALAVLMVSAVVVVLVSDEPFLDPDQAFPEWVIPNPDKRPEFVFPEKARTNDLSLNRFVDRFARVCVEAKYSDFRLMLSSKTGDPIVASRFESMFNALKQVRILAIDRMPDVPALGGPVYVMSVEYDLDPSVVRKGESTERRRIAITKENGEWRIGPVPHDLLVKVEQSAPTTSQPATKGPAASQPVNEPGSAPEAPKATANSPARLDS